jgi:LPXTG-motif cell wall-anchored protein
LPDATFDLYQWDGSDYVKVNTDPNQYTSAANGLISFPDLEYNTAYKLVETTSPIGYIIGDEPYYIILEHSDTTNYPVRIPSDDFTGSDPGSLLYVRNERSYELPETGGIGTHWFTIGGLTMMLGAAALIRKKQHSKGGESS